MSLICFSPNYLTLGGRERRRHSFWVALTIGRLPCFRTGQTFLSFGVFSGTTPGTCFGPFAHISPRYRHPWVICALVIVTD